MDDRFVCHECGRSFSQNLSDNPLPKCPRCGSEFVEIIERPTTADNANTFDGNSGFTFQRFPGGFFMSTSNTGGASFNPITSPFPIPLSEMIRFVVAPQSIPPEHSLWRILGIHGDPRDYVNDEELFQRHLTELMNTGGNPVVGLTEDQIDDLQRDIISSITDTPCAICQDPFKEGEETIILPCHHQFHAECVSPWLKKVSSCPICRLNLKPDH